MRLLVGSQRNVEVQVGLQMEHYGILQGFAELCGGWEAMYEFLGEIVERTEERSGWGVEVTLSIAKAVEELVRER